jgi:hypothetical protein
LRIINFLKHFKMSITSGTEFNSLGGGLGGFGGLGSLGGFGLIGLLGLGDLFNRDRDRNVCAPNDGVGIADALSAISSTKDLFVAESRATNADIAATRAAISGEICDVKTEALKNVFALSTQITANQTLTAAQFAELERSGERNTAAIIAVINANEQQSLRDKIADLQRNVDRSNIEISVSNSQTQAQAQQQAQLQGIYGVISNLANDLQIVKQGQTIFNSGTMASSGTQAASNTKVN